MTQCQTSLLIPAGCQTPDDCTKQTDSKQPGLYKANGGISHGALHHSVLLRPASKKVLRARQFGVQRNGRCILGYPAGGQVTLPRPSGYERADSENYR